MLSAVLRAEHEPTARFFHLSTPDSILMSYLSLEIGRTYDGMMIAIPAPHWVLFRELSAKAFANTLRDLAASVHLSRYQKHPRGPKKPPPQRTAYQSGQHVSTAKLLAQRGSC